MGRLDRAVSALFAALMGLILAIVLCAFEGTSFACKRPFALSQGVMLLLGTAGVALVCAAAARLPAPRRRAFWSLVPWAALFAVQLVLCFHAYFLTGWDSQGVIESAYAIAGGDADIHAAALSLYPNNIPLVLLFAAVLRVVRLLLGNPGLDRCVYVLIAGQCALNTLTGMLVWRLSARTTGSRRLARCVALVYAAFVGLSPWLMIPYSDSMALIFPTAILTVYQAHREGKWGRLAWPLIGLLTGVGYLIKPQAAIVTIAIALLEAIRLPACGRARRWMAHTAATALITALIVGPGAQAMTAASPIALKPERRMGMLHFVMMGLNTATNGTYAWEDVQRSAAEPTREARTQMQIEEIRSRLDAMTPGEMLTHLKKKTLTNYADGTFAWGCEGGFYREWIADKDSVLSPFLKRLIRTDDALFQVPLTGLHSVWLALLLGCALCGAAYTLRGARDRDGVLRAAMLALIGLTMFEWIFEARARYLYLYAPFYVMLGVEGFRQTALRLKGRVRRA